MQRTHDRQLCVHEDIAAWCLMSKLRLGLLVLHLFSIPRYCTLCLRRLIAYNTCNVPAFVILRYAVCFESFRELLIA